MYDDTDSHANEIAELYSYIELRDLNLIFEAFKDIMQQYGLPSTWQDFSLAQKILLVSELQSQMKNGERDVRMVAALSILYLAQGCWKETKSEAEQQSNAIANVILLYEQGVFSTFVHLLDLEIQYVYFFQ